MEKNVFKFHVQDISYGSSRVVMLINDKEIHYNASYLGQNPLASFIDVCEELYNEEDTYYVVWQAEPGILEITLDLKENNQLHIDIIDKNGDNDIKGEWHEIIPFEAFASAIVSEGFRVLNTYGLYGYQCSWSDHTEFPLSNLLHITGNIQIKTIEDSYISDIAKEIECLQQNLSKLECSHPEVSSAMKFFNKANS